MSKTTKTSKKIWWNKRSLERGSKLSQYMKIKIPSFSIKIFYDPSLEPSQQDSSKEGQNLCFYGENYP